MPTTQRPVGPRPSPSGKRTAADGTKTNARSPGREAPLELEIVTITPELAQEWLDRGGTNRKLTRRRIEAMTAAIQRGEWRLTGEAIDRGRVGGLHLRHHLLDFVQGAHGAGERVELDRVVQRVAVGVDQRTDQAR